MFNWRGSTKHHFKDNLSRHIFLNKKVIYTNLDYPRPTYVETESALSQNLKTFSARKLRKIGNIRKLKGESFDELQG